MSDWCILRTAGRSTLPLAQSLAASGYEVWTPAETLARRRPRSKARVSFRVPMAPTYVFARSRHLSELVALANDPARQEGFSVFTMTRGIPLIEDAELSGLREAEESLRPKPPKPPRVRKRGQAFDSGEQVRLSEASFAGMQGKIMRSDPKNTFVDLGGSMRLKISTFILRDSGLDDAQAA